MKYAVVCYSENGKSIESHDEFDNRSEACDYLQTYAENTYEQECDNCNDDERKSIDFTIEDDGSSAYLSSYEGNYVWTWEVIEINE